MIRLVFRDRLLCDAGIVAHAPWLIIVVIFSFGFRDAHANAPSPLVAQALAAEARFETETALRLFLSALQQQPDNAFILQKISRQYSDTVNESSVPAERKQRAEQALAYAQRAAALEPDNPVNVLSIAIAHGKIALHSDLRTRVDQSRHVRAQAERALALDPNYAWAHHVLGRWHHEVAQVGPAGRLVARVVYGGLPPASLDEAIQHLQRAVELDAENVLHHVELGFAYDAARRPEDARDHWRKALSLPTREKHDLEGKARAQQALERSNLNFRSGK